MQAKLEMFWRDDAGATAVEYGLIAVVLSLAIVAGAGTAIDAIGFLFGDTGSALVQAFTN